MQGNKANGNGMSDERHSPSGEPKQQADGGEGQESKEVVKTEENN